MKKILLVEDDDLLNKTLTYNLISEGYDTVSALNAGTAAALLTQAEYDLVLLDINLPDGNGYDLCRLIKPESPDTLVIFLTAKGAVEDRIRGLKAGADDYLAKPFQVGELLARVEAVLRRIGIGGKQMDIGDVSIYPDSRSVTKNGCPVTLTAKEFDLLVELVQNKNVALYRDQLYEKVWKEPFFGETRTLDAHIQRLRRKLGWEDRIKTVFRIGYRLEG